MKWRYKELVARIPAAKVGGSSIQYYIEVKDQAGTTVAQLGQVDEPEPRQRRRRRDAALLPGLHRR